MDAPYQRFDPEIDWPRRAIMRAVEKVLMPHERSCHAEVLIKPRRVPYSDNWNATSSVFRLKCTLLSQIRSTLLLFKPFAGREICFSVGLEI